MSAASPAVVPEIALNPLAVNPIAKLLSPAHVVVDADLSSKKRVFEHAGLVFENHQGVARAKVFDSLFARERLGSTGLGRGVAVPHGRIAGITQAVTGFFRLTEGVPFDAPDGEPVRLFFFLLAPEKASSDLHLQVYATVAEMFSDDAFRERILALPTAADVHRELITWASPMASAA
jgi:nitrogen PTS system EIIA component